MNKLKITQEEYQRLSPLLINAIGKRHIFHHIEETGKKFKLNNKSIAINILYVTRNTEEIRHANKSKYNLNRENQITLLMISDNQKWHYLAVKSLSVLFRRILSNNNGEFYCLNFFMHLEQKINLKNKKMYVKIMLIIM